ncbi:CHAP domain-containing protein [Nonomuraea sp. NPDC047529]|uniref:CHAP domain-containing protein n=1 Tax=Nonomuraea sp. NPDC047529 TaxID=3155623 RepID=UPI00340D4FB6
MSVFRGGVTLDPIADALLKQVRQEVGYKEKSGQSTKFGQWYADRVQDTQYRNAPWCDMFIAWAADRTGLSPYVGQFAWTPSHAAWFIKQKAWAQRPEPGALVFYDWSGGKSYKGVDHVGIVERVEGKKIHTIEANVDRVWLKRKVRDTDKVVGYGLPRLVKAGADQAAEIRSTERPFVPAPRTEVGRSSPLDVLGTPPALLVAMVLVTVVLSLRVTGRRRGTHRRFGWPRPWNAPEDRSAGRPGLDDRRTVDGPRAARIGDGEDWAPRVTVLAPDQAPQDASRIRVGTTPPRQRVAAGAGRPAAGRTPTTRRKPYTPKN